MQVAVRRWRFDPSAPAHPQDEEAVQALQAEGVQAGQPQRPAGHGDQKHGQHALQIQVRFFF